MRRSRRRQALYMLIATFIGTTGFLHFLDKHKQRIRNMDSTHLEMTENLWSEKGDVIAKTQLSKTVSPVVPGENPGIHRATSDVGVTSPLVTENAEEELIRLYDDLQNSKTRCDRLVYIGKKTPRETYEEGTFPICLDSKFWPETNQCLVYSYGINDNWGFDDGMAELFGCENHAFDAHMFNFKDHRRSRNVWFHRKALGNRTSDSVYLEGKNDIIARDNWGKSELERLRVVKMRTLAAMITELGHNGKTLDVLRLDSESTTQSYEFDIIRNLLESDTIRCVRQLTLEAHFFGLHDPTRGAKELRDKRDVFRKLEDSGFELLDFQGPEVFSPEYAQNIVTSLSEKEMPLVFVTLWGSPEAKPCAN